MEQQPHTNGVGEADGAIGRNDLVSAWRDRRAVRQAVAGQLLSLANLMGRPVVDPSGTRVGRVNDVIVRWESVTPHPPVTGIVVRVGKGFATIAAPAVTLTIANSFRQAPLFYGLFTLQILIGAGVSLAPGNLVSLVVNAQVLNGIITPLLLTYVLILANRRAVLGSAVNGRGFNVVATISVAVVGLLSFVVLVQTVAGL
jgi:hypothetical protein